MKFFSLFGNVIDRFCIVAGAFIGSQIPQFMHQYSQRLAGHVDALQKLLAQLRQISSLSHRTLEQYIQKFKDSSDPDFIQQGIFMQGILKRWENLQSALDHLTQSPLWMRPYYFISDFQSDIAQSTLTSFQMGFSFTLEGCCYVGGGMILGWLFYQLVSKCFTLGYRRAQSLFKQSV